ncbi:alcohol oxidase [Flammula alnicola]|nr:alcohol oxidase [Flammula alnicola]
MRFNPLSLLPFAFLHASSLHELNETPKEFDYIVIGAGNAGLAIASRLSEDPHTTVAVLEAGSNVENLPEVFIPGLTGLGQTFTTLNWRYETLPQEHLGGRTTIINAGKALGGGTIINSMIFPRAEKEEYDAWGALNNKDPNWTWDALLPYFKRSEIFSPPNAAQIASGVKYQEDVHGTSVQTGRVKVGYPNFFYPQSEMWQKASGFKPSPDLANGNPQGTVGISPNSLDAHNNTRCSSVCAYYTPFVDRPNLTVLTNVFVTRILWDPPRTSKSRLSAPLKATAVEFQDGEAQISHLSVKKEVILSAGTLASPRILEHSGVGNETILTKAGVKSVLNLPTVGENLADHVHGWANAFTNASLTRDLLVLEPKFETQQRELWYHNRTGVLSAAPRSLGLAAASNLFAASELVSLVQDAQSNITHYAKLFSNGNADLEKGIEAQHAIVLNFWKRDKVAPVELNLEPGYGGPTLLPNRPARKYTTINAVLFAPLSRGRTHITSSNPLDKSAIDPAYYAHPLDLATHVKAIELGRKMLRTPPLDSIYEGEYEPGEDKKTEQDVTTWARGASASDNHVIGTLAMMPKELGGVVDTRLRVYGIQNVRVVDASVIPFPISAHLESTIYMIAERAADFVKEDSRHL